ncbi:LysR substrate-binding domain-containing protein [Novosphingobium cyanobacteriorum]|uniref:LysR substrate-binding domain-containing protein n=1 Tax=Novosphingobium cyanobacteriorum TaxID=3024215 RepID=A0ABT6CIG4_9SPHN|nr:LysR substrate-binding domain-containing protein [Novosphingobium cyanobacteriorum]MDF8333710.1 LysR substrate-binding domain-containing protein [Novosphingobium cyanobacteriorum]
MPNLAWLRAFEAYGRTGGIRRAAALIGIDHSAVSRHLKALENLVGVNLIDASAPGGLTEAGLHYYHTVSDALSAIEAETTRLRKARRDRLTLWCVPGLAVRWMLPRLRGFTDTFPDIALELRPSDAPPDPRDAEVDGDVRYYRDGGAAAAMVRSNELARPSVFPVCSPGYLATLPPLASAGDLLGARLLHEESDIEWRDWLAGQGISLPGDALPGPRLWHAHLVLDECRNGRGIALTNAFLLGDDLASGRLVRVEPQAKPFNEVSLGAYFLTMRAERWSERPVALFRQWLKAAMTSDLGGDF